MHACPQWDCNQQPQQKFVSFGNYQYQSATNPSVCIDLSAGLLTPGNQLEVWNCAGAVPGAAIIPG